MSVESIEQLGFLVKHPLLQHNLTILRKSSTHSSEFRRVMNNMGELLAYEVMRDLQLAPEEISTPMEKHAVGHSIVTPIIAVSIMRAGNGLLEGALRTLPFAGVGHIGIYRDKFIQNTVEYYFRLPKDSEGKRVLLMDPLLATGDTAVAAINRLKEYATGPIRMITLLASRAGLEKVREYHPDVEVYTTSVERACDQNGYLLPGLGDAGDRLYGLDT